MQRAVGSSAAREGKALLAARAAQESPTRERSERQTASFPGSAISARFSVAAVSLAKKQRVAQASPTAARSRRSPTSQQERSPAARAAAAERAAWEFPTRTQSPP